jgi:hypothetical protein
MLSMPRIVRPDSCNFCARKLGPPLDWLLADPLSETKNAPNGQMFSQTAESKSLCRFTPGHVDLDEWDAGFRQTKSKTPVPTHYGLSIYLRGVFWKGLQWRRLASYRLW